MPPQLVDVTLSLFGGAKTDIAPSDCPEGISPDTQDGIYLPGDWQSRPCLSKLYPAPFPSGVSVLYEKTYIQPNNDPLTLILTSDGKLWMEDVGNSPGAYAQIDTVAPGLYAQSVTAFGREYIAFSDLLHGQGVPLQYDGTNLDRVTMDGPGANPIGMLDETTTYPITASPAGLLNLGTFNVLSGSQAGFVVTLVVTTGFSTFILQKFFRNGDSFLIAGVGAGYNGTFAVTSMNQVDATHIAITYLATTSGLAPVGAAGTIATGYYDVVPSVLTQGVPENLSITIAGAGVAGYDGTWQTRVAAGDGDDVLIYIPGFPVLANSGGGTFTLNGNISVGQHGMVVMWLTRQGALSQPSPIQSWTAAGGRRVILSDIPIGPANVVARVFGFTGAGGDNFFVLPATVTLPQPSGPPLIIGATVLPDNTSTMVTLDFSDNALFAGVAIDQIGNDLFDQRVLGPVLGFFSYASRLMCWGDYQKVENFLNMGFCGGYLSGVLTTPLGWNVVTAGGILINGGPWAAGMAWQITGDGSANPKGKISQSAYQDSFGTQIALPNTAYSFRLWAKASAANLAGSIIAEFSSATTGFSSTATIPISQVTIIGGFSTLVAFTLELPAVIPSDLLFQLYAVNLPNAATVIISENEPIYSQNPYNNVLVRSSYPENPEGFAQTTGNLGAADDDSAVQCCALLRQPALLETLDGVHIFQDNDGEPDTWQVNQLTRAVGALALRAGDPGKFGTGDAAEDWALIASKNGVYLFAGSEFWKVSQEISRGALPQSEDPRPTWDDINWAAQQTIVAKNDPSSRRAYFAVPLNGANQPNYVFVLDYREMDTATQIASAPPVHITIQGKMKSSDLTRKWSTWNVSANDLEILVRPGNQRLLFFAGGARNGMAYGNIYSLDPAKLTDDDYGQIFPYYTTYAFTDHDQEQALGLGSDLHLYKKIHAFVAGVGLVTITPIVNSLYNFQPGLRPRVLAPDLNAGTFLASDLEWTTVGLRGQRVFFRISVQPLPGATDVQIRLQKFVVGMMKDPIAMTRQSAI